MAVPKSILPAPPGLPRQLTSFIGRAREVERVKSLLAGVPLLTLTGPGGVGKTRLALQVAGEVAGEFEHGARWVSLAPLTFPEGVVPAIAEAIGVAEVRQQTLLESVGEALASQEILLVLDNFEHVLGATSDVAYLLASAHRLKILVTSRIHLHLYGEQEFPVPPMQVPGTEFQVRGLEASPSQPGTGNAELGTQQLATIESYEAVALFVGRARAVRPDFALSAGNVADVIEICRRLDSLPLAIELAAARCKVLSPQAILTRLQSRLVLLTGGASNLPVRQQTLRNTISWSYDLLDDAEKQLLRELSIFVNGCTLEAVEAISPGSRPLDLVLSLANKSLVNVSGAQDERSDYRITMLETIREFAGGELEEDENGAGGEDLLRERHAIYYLSLAEASESHMGGPKQGPWLRRLEAEHGNLRAALRWARDRERWDAGLRLAGALGRFWDVRGHWTEGREWLATMLGGQGDEGSRAWARAHLAAGQLARRQGDFPSAHSHLNRSIEIFRASGDRPGVAAALSILGHTIFFQGDLEGTIPVAHEALSILRELGDRAGEAYMLALEGNVATKQSNFEQGRTLLEQSMRIYDELGDRWSAAGTLNALGVVLSTQTGHYGAARQLYERSLAIYRELGDRRGTALTLNGVGEALRSEGDYEAALPYYQESLAIYRELGDRSGIGTALHNQGHAALFSGDSERAAALFLESLQIYREHNTTTGIAECLAGLAGVAVANGQPRRAAWLFGKASALRAETGTEFDPTDQEAIDRHTAKARAALGEATFSAARAEGRILSLDEVLALATAEPAQTSSTAQTGALATGSFPTRTPQSEQPPHAALTRRELEVLRLVATGLTDAQVAERLFLSPQTIHAHLRSVYSKLAVANRLEATRYAIEHKLA